MSIPADQNLTKKFYVWQLPIRLFHWINVAAGLTLILTGWYIATPFLNTLSDQADGFLMGGLRITHFSAAFVFTLNLVFRLYWAFKGNQYAKSNPLTKEFWKEVGRYIKYYLFLGKADNEHVKHNALAQLTYWIFFGGGAILMMLTGYYMFFEIQLNSTVGSLFTWVPSVFGGSSFDVRSFHHLTAWVIILFSFIHLYMSARDSVLSKNQTLTSIFTGYKRVSKDFKGDSK